MRAWIRFAVVAVLCGFTLVAAGEKVEAPKKAAPKKTASCTETCYAEKSKAYRKCTEIPPADRPARARCFNEADAKLQRCLQTCEKRKAR